MHNSQQIPDIVPKIRQIRTAVFCDESNALLKFKNSIIVVDTADDNGNIWFRTSQPYKDTSDFPDRFPARLRFYRKKAGYRVNVEGTASIVRMDAKEMLPGREALIRLEINRVEVNKLSQQELFDKKRLDRSIKKWLWSFFYTLFLNRPNHRTPMALHA